MKNPSHNSVQFDRRSAAGGGSGRTAGAGSRQGHRDAHRRVRGQAGGGRRGRRAGSVTLNIRVAGCLVVGMWRGVWRWRCNLDVQQMLASCCMNFVSDGNWRILPCVLAQRFLVKLHCLQMLVKHQFQTMVTNSVSCLLLQTSILSKMNCNVAHLIQPALVNSDQKFASPGSAAAR